MSREFSYLTLIPCVKIATRPVWLLNSSARSSEAVTRAVLSRPSNGSTMLSGKMANVNCQTAIVRPKVAMGFAN
ncbi:hypothetical protein AC249_AIPGENE6 [Exaiptasia diaphana]|nr:hypothetical protein AC249_AIPGENE6 [Exaiptasia diaphana]